MESFDQHLAWLLGRISMQMRRIVGDTCQQSMLCAISFTIGSNVSEIMKHQLLWVWSVHKGAIPGE